jgi:hypothetical protein
MGRGLGKLREKYKKQVVGGKQQHSHTPNSHNNTIHFYQALLSLLRSKSNYEVSLSLDEVSKVLPTHLFKFFVRVTIPKHKAKNGLW